MKEPLTLCGGWLMISRWPGAQRHRLMATLPKTLVGANNDRRHACHPPPGRNHTPLTWHQKQTIVTSGEWYCCGSVVHPYVSKYKY